MEIKKGVKVEQKEGMSLAMKAAIIPVILGIFATIAGNLFTMSGNLSTLSTKVKMMKVSVDKNEELLSNRRVSIRNLELDVIRLKTIQELHVEEEKHDKEEGL